jgi:hypothetical protein
MKSELEEKKQPKRNFDMAVAGGAYPDASGCAARDCRMLVRHGRGLHYLHDLTSSVCRRARLFDSARFHQPAAES